jgi:DNA polymerase-3 subunit gamma/tau
VSTAEQTPERIGASLATWYRPRTFSDVAGQRHVTAILRRQIANESLPAQILFAGGSGLGKTTLARITAAALLCESSPEEREAMGVAPGDDCGQCESCRDITLPGRTHADVIEFDAASNGGKDEIRAIAERAQLLPMRGKRKVYIIDEAHGLTGPGGQAFLKLLEEPPPHVTFMLATTDPAKMAPANRGRCSEYELLPPSMQDMAKNVLRVAELEGWSLSPEAALAVVESSDLALGVRATLMSLEKVAPLLDNGEEVTPEVVAQTLRSLSRPALAALTRALEARSANDAFHALGELATATTTGAIMDALVLWARDALLSSTPETFETSRYRLQELIDRPRTPGQLELAIANITNPLTTAALPSLIESATALVRELGEITKSQLLPAGVPVGVQVGVPEVTQPPLTPAESSTPAPIEEDSATTTLTRVEFMEGLTGESLIVELLERATLELTAGTLRILATPEIKEELRKHGAPLRAYAKALGIKIVLVGAPAPSIP